MPSCLSKLLSCPSHLVNIFTGKNEGSHWFWVLNPNSIIQKKEKITGTVEPKWKYVSERRQTEFYTWEMEVAQDAEEEEGTKGHFDCRWMHSSMFHNVKDTLFWIRTLSDSPPFLVNFASHFRSLNKKEILFQSSSSRTQRSWILCKNIKYQYHTVICIYRTEELLSFKKKMI